MTSLTIPVVDIHNENFSELWPSLLLALKTSTFIAVDTELSGLGERKNLLNQCVEERYKSICHAARTRSILSLGIACFKKLPEKGDNAYLSQIFNLTLLCMENYTIEPQSVQFLVQHGFDFNKQYSAGIPYQKGNDKDNEHHVKGIRTLFLELLRARKPLILHNGLIDLAFLYQCFYAQLPDNLGSFIADLSEMFPAGIYDTKYVSEFEIRFTASYLEYAYKKCKRENSKLIDLSRKHLSIEFCRYPASMSTFVDYRLCSLPDPDKSNSEEQHICDRFSAYGWCPNGLNCTQSHNIDLIIDEDEKIYEQKKKQHKGKRQKSVEPSNQSIKEEGSEKVLFTCMEPPCKQPRGPSSLAGTSIAHGCINEASQNELADRADCRMEEDKKESRSLTIILESAVKSKDPSGDEKTVSTTSPTEGTDLAGRVKREDSKSAEGGTHRVGFDAFMTGYIMGYASMLKKGGSSDTSPGNWLPDCHNKIYLSGKNVPLQIMKSVFSKSSRAHAQKVKLLSGSSW
ncbi:target of EGR1 protein 1 [Xenopus tropicalis]|uniref:Target of EGR1 protein 1 n=1 Tax=Xenopus tropicalis TaxID=8364 RepID=B0JZ51_XENTR|nr:target of EGR1 protein 1 [Xenopus tropicalis]AAI59038.1 LOC100145153 protein [Xenopus tropicalis]|eukprot:NP_001120127.1 target of EGR1 protein 1 [Xenopus tropicalis]